MTAAFEIRPIHEEELAAWIGSLHVPFNKHGDPVAEADFRRPFTDLSRCLAAFEGGGTVGTFRSLGLTLSVPGGGLVNTDAITAVTVLPTHHRRGLLRTLTDGRVVLDVRNPDGYASGRFALEGGPAGATCVPTTEEPGLVLPAEALGAAYLGGASVAMLATAGRAEQVRPGALATADAMFRWSVAPWCAPGFCGGPARKRGAVPPRAGVPSTRSDAPLGRSRVRWRAAAPRRRRSG